MAGNQDVIQLPVRYIDPSDLELMAVSIQKNFYEIERYLSILQSYVKQISGGTISDITEKAQVWDRAANINADGTFPASKLTEKLVGLNYQLQLANEAVTAAKIAVGAIQNLHFKDGEITLPKMNFPFHQIY